MPKRKRQRPFVPAEPFDLEIPDFDLGNDLLASLRAGNMTLQHAREVVTTWYSEGRISLARAAAERIGVELPDDESSPDLPVSSPETFERGSG